MNNSKKIEKFQFRRLGKDIEDLRKQICISNEILNDSLNNIFNKFEISSFKKHLKEKREEAQKKLDRDSGNSFFEGQIFAYDEVIKLSNDYLKDIDSKKL